MEKDILLRQETILQMLKTSFSDSKTKVNSDALKLIRKYIHVFIMETAYRTLEQAKTEDSPTVELQHFEKILPQLLLDF